MEDPDFEVANAAEWQTVDRKKTKPARHTQASAAAAPPRSNSRRPYTAPRPVAPTPIRPPVVNKPASNVSGNVFGKLAELENRKTPSPPNQPRAMNNTNSKPPVHPKSANSYALRNQSNSARPRGNGSPHAKASTVDLGRNAFRNARPSTVKIDLPAPYSTLKELVNRGLPELPPNVIGECLTFNYITDRTGAFVPPPRDEAHFINVWGPPAQAHEAEKLIKSLFFPQNPPVHPVKKSNKADKFATTNLKAMQKAEIAEAKRRTETFMDSLREKPENPTRFPESLLFLWPDDEFPMNECLGGDKLTDFDDLRRKTGCHIYIDDANTNCIRVDGDDPAKITKIMQGLRLHWAGLLAKTNVKVKAYFVQVPPVRAEVAVDIKTRRGRAIHVPRPYDPEIRDDVKWDADARFLRAKNEIRLRAGVERSLQALKFSNGHLRMRVNFGTFVLREYQNLRQGRSRYTFEEFRNMLLLSRTRGYLDTELSTEHRQGLLPRCLQRTDLLTLFNPRHSSLENTLPSYTISFNFEEGNARLRLEVEFDATPSGQYERGNRTWFKTTPEDDIELERPILQVGIMDFERSDWELDIKLMGSPTDNSNISRSLKEFANMVGLRRSEVDDPTAPGRLRASFPVENSQSLKFIEEKTSLRYRLKQTNYVLEMARYDTFRCTSSVGAFNNGVSFTYGAPQVSEIGVTTWGASLYDTTWDNMIGQNATSARGENVRWKPSFKAFFPSRNPETKDDVYAGFGEFLGLVQEVAEMLRPEHKMPPPANVEEAEKRERECSQSPALEDIIPFNETWTSINQFR